MEFSSKNRTELILFIGKISLVSLLVLIISLTTAYLMWSEGRILVGVDVGGISISGLKVREATCLLSKEIKALGGKKVVLVYKGRPLNLVVESIGINVNVSASIKKAYQIGRNGSFWRQMISRWRIYRHGYSIRPVFNNNQAILASFLHLLEAGMAIEPIRSVVTVNREGTVSYSSSRLGVVINRPVLIRKLENAIFQKEAVLIKVPVTKVAPPLTESDIKKWNLDQTLGIYTTKFDDSHKDRVTNLYIASNAINNVIVYPGQRFSFNTWVGPRVTDTGYKEAPVVFMGKLVPGIGGGICQVSSTLYNAALLANLQIVRRTNHSLASTYVPLARDAAVVYDDIDLIIENTNNFPILLVTNIKPPYLTVAVLGKKTNWKNINLESKIIKTFPFKTIYTQETSLSNGKKIKVSNGQKGFKAQLWRIIEYADGTIKKELINTSIYSAQPEEYKVGTKPE